MTARIEHDGDWTPRASAANDDEDVAGGEAGFEGEGDVHGETVADAVMLSDSMPRPAGDSRRSGRRRSRRAARLAAAGDEQVPTGRVTALLERRRGSARYVVSIEGMQAAVVSAELVAHLGLRVGEFVGPEQAERLGREAMRLAVFDKGVELLAVRARSTRELRQRLTRAGAAADAISWALTRLESLGVLNDASFAYGLAQSRIVGGGASRRAIANELQRRGVSREVADAAISQALGEVALDEEGAARAAAVKRLKAMRSHDAATQRRRLYAFLARRGYAPDVVQRVMRSVLGRSSDAPDGGDETGDDTGDGEGDGARRRANDGDGED